VKGGVVLEGCKVVDEGVGVELRGWHTCSALMTSMITPPFSMRARPALTEKLFSPSAESLGPWPLTPLVMGRSDGIVVVGRLPSVQRDEVRYRWD